MDAEGISIGIGSGVAIVALKEAFSWLRAKYAKTEIPQPLRSTIDGEVRTQKSPQYVTVGECNRRMCEHTSEIQNLRNEVINGQKEIVSKLDELDQRSENRAIASNQRIDRVMERSAEMRGQVEATKDLVKSAFIGGKK